MLRLIPRIIYLFLLLLFTLTSKANAQLERVEIEVKGLACPFCSYGLEKKLNKIEGLKDIKIFIDEGLARLEFEKSSAKPFEAIKAGIKDAGFTPGKIKAILSGMIQQENGSFFFVTPEPKMRFELEKNKNLKILTKKPNALKMSIRISAILKEQLSHLKKIGGYFLCIESFELIK